MKTLSILAGMAVLLVSGYASAATMTSGRPSAVLTREQCLAVWHIAVPTGRYLYRQDAGPYIINFKLAVRTRTEESPSVSSKRPAAKAW
jgi:hypothetical protein